MILSSAREKIFFYNLPVILFCFLPFLLITGPFLSDLSVSLISIIFLTYCFNKKKFSYFKNKYFYFFLFFWIYLVLNSIFVNFNLDSFKISFFFFRYGIFVIAIATYISEDDKFIKYFFYCIFFCFLILILDGFFQYFTRVNIFGFTTNNEFRTSSFFNDELILGSYISRLLPLLFSLSFFFLKKENIFFKILILTFILSEVLVFLSGERTAFFYINISALFVIFLSNKLFKLRLFILLASLFLIFSISFINPLAKERIIDQTFKQMNIVLNEKNNLNINEIYIFSKQHTHHYITAYRMFLDNKIFGVGVKNFRNFCGDKKFEYSELSCSTHPHNSYIQILAELGIVGFLFLIFIFFYFFKNLFKHFFLKFKKKSYFSDFEICLLSGILIYIWPIVPTGNIFNNWLTIILLLYLPILKMSRKLLENKASKDNYI